MLSIWIVSFSDEDLFLHTTMKICLTFSRGIMGFSNSHSWVCNARLCAPYADTLLARVSNRVTPNKNSNLVPHPHTEIPLLSVGQPWKLREKPRSGAHAGCSVQPRCRNRKFCILGNGLLALGHCVLGQTLNSW